jgi:hypothetical protein
MARLALATILLIGCGFPTDTAGRRYQCDEGGRCPEGTVCVAGYCEQDVSVIDGGGARDAAPVDICPDGQLLVRDRFDELVDGQRWFTWANGDALTSAVDGRLVIEADPGASAGVIGTSEVELARVQASLEAGAPSHIDGTAGALGLMDGGTDVAVLAVERRGPDIRGTVWPGSKAEVVVGAIEYNADLHRFWRITVAAGTAVFEVSSNERDWTTLGSRAIDDLPALVRVQAHGASFGAERNRQTYDLLTVCQAE